MSMFRSSNQYLVAASGHRAQVLDQVAGVQVVVDRGSSERGSGGGSNGRNSGGVGSSGRSSDGGSIGGRPGSGGSSSGNSGALGSSGRNRSDGCSDPGVVQTDIGLVCDISTLSDKQKVELPLNHFTPGDGDEFVHEACRRGANKWKLSVQRAWQTELEWLFP